MEAYATILGDWPEHANTLVLFGVGDFGNEYDLVCLLWDRCAAVRKSLKYVMVVDHTYRILPKLPGDIKAMMWTSPHDTAAALMVPPDKHWVGWVVCMNFHLVCDKDPLLKTKEDDVLAWAYYIRLLTRVRDARVVMNENNRGNIQVEVADHLADLYASFVWDDLDDMFLEEHTDTFRLCVRVLRKERSPDGVSRAFQKYIKALPD